MNENVSDPSCTSVLRRQTIHSYLQLEAPATYTIKKGVLKESNLYFLIITLLPGLSAEGESEKVQRDVQDIT